MAGRYCAIEPLDAALHLDDLYEAFAEDVDGRLWTYMSVGPFESKAAFSAWLDVADSTAGDRGFQQYVNTSLALLGQLVVEDQQFFEKSRGLSRDRRL